MLKFMMNVFLVVLLSVGITGCYRGEVLNPSFTPEAVAKYKELADEGDASAQLLYSVALRDGLGTKENKRAAFKYAKMAADQGFERSYFCVWRGYAEGWAGTTNTGKALKWQRKFLEWVIPEAEQGNARAQALLGYCYATGQGMEKDLEKATKWCLAAAKQGYGPAQRNVGNFYMNGVGVEKDNEEAVRWYRKAAENGDESAQYNLAVCYENGWGVEKNMAEAAKWYSKAAKQGHAKAQGRLGLCYENGWGVVVDKEEAMKWYKKAAERGDDLAQRKLDTLGFAQGSGCGL